MKSMLIIVMCLTITISSVISDNIIFGGHGHGWGHGHGHHQPIIVKNGRETIILNYHGKNVISDGKDKIVWHGRRRRSPLDLIEFIANSQQY